MIDSRNPFLLMLLCAHCSSGAYRQWKYYKLMTVEGLVNETYHSLYVSNVGMCSKHCLLAGCDGFSLSLRQGDGYLCLLNTGVQDLPLGVWDVYLSTGLSN